SSKRQHQVRSPTSYHPRWPRPCSRVSRPWWSNAWWVGSAAPTPAHKESEEKHEPIPGPASLSSVQTYGRFTTARSDSRRTDPPKTLLRIWSKGVLCSVTASPVRLV